MSNKALPAHKIDLYWPITAAIWENYSANGELYFTYTLQRTYRTKEEEYRSTNSFSAEDTRKLEKTIDEVWRWLMAGGRDRIREYRKRRQETSATAASGEHYEEYPGGELA